MAHRADPLRRGANSALLIPTLVGVAVLQIAWLGWFLVEPLPNAQNVGGNVRRFIFLIRAFPHVVPGVGFDQSNLGLALGELSHIENLPQRLPIVLAATCIVAGALALGHLIVRAAGLRHELTIGERLPLAYGLGTTALGVLTLLGGRLGVLAPWPVRLGLLALVATEAALRVRDQRSRIAPDRPPPELESTDRRLPRILIMGARIFMELTTLVVLTLVARLYGISVRRTIRAGFVVLVVIEAALRVSDRRRGGRRETPTSAADPSDWIGPWGLVLGAGPFLVMMALGAMLPAIDFDAIEYHLQGPKEYFQAGRIAFLPHNVYTSMPFGVEMLHLLGMEVFGDWWWGALAGQLLVAAYAPAAAAMIAISARRLGSPRAAAIAATVYLTTPWIYRMAIMPYVEGPLCYYHAALIWAAVRAAGAVDDRVRLRLWAVAGLLAGGAMACKYPALVSAVVPFGVVSLVAATRARDWRIPAAYVLGWAVVMTPWLAKNVIDTGNPVYPLGYRVFGGSLWDPAREAKWSNVHGPKGVSREALGESIVDVAGRSDWQSPLYVALVPLSLMRGEYRRRAWTLWVYAVYLFATWWLLTHRLDRFWLPLLPPLAVLAGLGADWVRSRLWSVILATLLFLSIATNLSYSSTALTGLNEWTGDLRALREDVPRMLNLPLARLDTELPAGSKVLLVGQAAVFHLRRPIVYNTVFDLETIERLTRDRAPDAIRRSLADLGVTHVYVDWFEIERYRSPGNYGFTDYVTPELFAWLVESGVLGRPEPMGLRQQLYRVERGGR